MRHSFPRCFSTLGCPDLSLAQVAYLALQFEVPLLEIRTLEGRLDIPALLKEAPGGWEGARDFLRSRKLQVQAIGTSFQLTNWHEAGWNELLQFAELAECLGAPYLRVFGGGSWEIEPSPEGLNAAAAVVERWESERDTHAWKVDLMLETHDAFSSTPRIQRLLDRMGRPLHLLWDTHHTWRMAGETPSFTWSQLGANVRHIHFKDSVTSEKDYTYTLPGAGEMPFQEVLSVLRDGKYAGAISLEWEKKWHPYLPELPEALAACASAGWW